MTARLTPEREAAIRRLIAPGRLPIPEAGAYAIHELLAELDAVRAERDLLRRHADAMVAGIETLMGSEDMSFDVICNPLGAYRAEFPATSERTTSEEEER